MRVLYITYNGLTDFIGQSQVLPYLLASARNGAALTVISFEKPERLARIGEAVRRQLDQAGIEWLPQRFHSFPPIAAKLLDQLLMRRTAFRVARERRPDFVHCRSYAPAVVGLALKRRFGTKLIFDMRGFWPDSRREGGRWRDGDPIGSRIYRRWKRHEAQLVAEADHIVSLTQVAKREMERWPSYRGAPISVIPCCADFDLFRPPAPDARAEARRALGIADGAPVLVYLGSLGSIYRLGEILDLFAAVRASRPDAVLLFVGRDTLDAIAGEAERLGREFPREQVRQVEAERAEVPRWLGAADAALCFYTPTFSSLHVSPTKLAEYLGCGLPVFCNAGVGDAPAILERTGGGHVLPDFGAESIADAARLFVAGDRPEPEALHTRARALLGLERAEAAYRAIYAAPEAAHEIV